MRFSSLRTFWISVISLLVMLLSSFASSASSMSMQMDMMSGHNMSANAVDCGMGMQLDNLHAQHNNHELTDEHAHQPSASPMHCGDDTDMIHNCCSATCFTSIALLSPAYQSQPLMTQLALIASERDISVIERSQSLYRPPII
ncbi:hypothetical protein [Enterovibrio calviensis]|uniref:hypothetical protein n=1 Tax=Enterovibrio calviensis TaxID=91359 RepID=UPI00047FFD9B|nr:hypothetical protein [Enterovibrio calviensis]